MPFYLSEYIGSGTKVDPFRPVGSDQPGWSAIDIRPDASLLDGGGLNACLLHVPIAFSDPLARFLADDKLESLTNPQKNFLQNKLGIDLSSPTLLRDIIATIMTAPPVNGWKGIIPGFLRWEIWLGGLLWEAPRISGGASDDFNRADEDPIATPWVTGIFSSTNVRLVSNAVIADSSANDCAAYYSGAASTSDQYAQLDTTGTTSSIGGPVVRVTAPGGFSGYEYDNFGSSTLGEILKWSLGVSTLLASGTITRANPLRIEAEGSTIRIYANGVLSQTTTDSAVTGGQPGLFTYRNDLTFDNWSGGDLTPPSIPTMMLVPPIVIGG